MANVKDLCDYLEAFAPTRLAEDWDNVGLLVGRRDAEVQRVMTCLTITPMSAAEAIVDQADMIVVHHPLPFRAMKRITDETTPGRMLLDLLHANVAVYSPHTAFDSAAQGINQQLAEGIGLSTVRPLVATPGDPDGLGSGRHGEFTEDTLLETVERRLMDLLEVPQLQAVGPADRVIRRAAVACGSAGTFLEPARRANCDLLITGETNFHTCLEAEATGVALLLPGHYASERFAVERLAGVLADQFADVLVWASRTEDDPIRYVS